MNCPVCGKEMEPGYLAAKPPVLWSVEPDKLLLVPGRHDVLLQDRVPERHLPAHLCRGCRKVVVDYQDRQLTT